MAFLARDAAGFALLSEGVSRRIVGDPFAMPREAWSLGPSGAELGPLLAPSVPRTVVGIGRSYRAHAEELGNAVPSEPLLFLKAASALIGPGAPLELRSDVGRIDFEGEIALVVGRPLEAQPADRALASILGVTAACDTTAREIQQGDRTFARGKSLPRSSPLGPMIDLDPEWGMLSVTTRVDGVERQRGGESLLLWPLAEMVAYVSRWIRLEPGDVILTGTPAGVGPIGDGSRIEVEVSGLPPLGCTARLVTTEIGLREPG